MLSHQLGLYRNAYDNKLEEGGDPNWLRRGLAQLNPICAPGTCWSYQNVAYDASSEIVSRVTGQSFEQSVKAQLFDPIGMASASMSMPALQASRSWARPHGHGGTSLPMIDTYYKVPAAGGVNSNVKDLSLWMLAQMGEMPGVLDQRLLDRSTPGWENPASAGGSAIISSGSTALSTAMAGAAMIMPATG